MGSGLMLVVGRKGDKNFGSSMVIFLLCRQFLRCSYMSGWLNRFKILIMRNLLLVFSKEFVWISVKFVKYMPFFRCRSSLLKRLENVGWVSNIIGVFCMLLLFIIILIWYFLIVGNLFWELCSDSRSFGKNLLMLWMMFL